MRRDSKRKSSRNSQKNERQQNGSKDKNVQIPAAESDAEDTVQCSGTDQVEESKARTDENDNAANRSAYDRDSLSTPTLEQADANPNEADEQILINESDKESLADENEPSENGDKIETSRTHERRRFASGQSEVSSSPSTNALCSSLNFLMNRALSSIKMEPMDMSVTEKYAQNLISSMAARFSMNGFNGQEMRMLPDNSAFSFNSRFGRPFYSPAELSPDSFAEQLRHNDSASMVVCRSQMGKNAASSMSIVSPESPPCGGARVQSGQSGTLHHFITRYTVERPDDPSRLGVDIRLEEGNPNDPVMEVECGGNKGLLFVTKLCQGSKGQSILFNDEWLTPNEFQFISGRETAKDWKRSIRHCGKSLKTLMTKGVLQVHTPVCECDFCKGYGHATADRMAKKRVAQTQFHQSTKSTENPAESSSDNCGSLGKTSYGADSSGSFVHKQGREGGLNSIISQLHNKKASNTADVASAAESLDLSMRAQSFVSNGTTNGRKRSRDTSMSSNNQEAKLNDQSGLPPFKRSHSTEYVQGDRDGQEADTSSSISEPLCLSSSAKDKDKTEALDPSSESRRIERPQAQSSCNEDSLFPGSPSRPVLRQHPEEQHGYRSRRQIDHSSYDAMRRGTSNLASAAYSQGCTTPPPGVPSFSQRPGDSYYEPLHRALSPAENSSGSTVGPKHAMVELISPHRLSGRNCGYPSEQDHRNKHKSDRGYCDGHPTYEKANNLSSYRYQKFPDYQHPSARTDASPPADEPQLFNGSPRPYFSTPGQAFDSRRQDYNRNDPSSKTARYDRRTKPASKRTPANFSKSRQRPYGQKQASRHKMLNLHNHAIPLLSLSYSKQKHSAGECSRDQYSTATRRNTDSSPPILDSNLNKTPASRSSIGGNETVDTCDSDAIRRLSSSAPPPQCRGDNVEASSCFQYNSADARSGKERSRTEIGMSSRLMSPVANNNVAGESAFRDVKSSRFSSSYALSPDSSHSFCDNGTPRNTGIFDYQAIERQRMQEFCNAIEDMAGWSVDGVCDFLREIGCKEYEKVFRENSIDGDALPLLTECHLTGTMGLKLGHALKVISRIHRRLGNYQAMLRSRSLTSSCFHGSSDRRPT